MVEWNSLKSRDRDYTSSEISQIFHPVFFVFFRLLCDMLMNLWLQTQESPKVHIYWNIPQAPRELEKIYYFGFWMVYVSCQICNQINVFLAYLFLDEMRKNFNFLIIYFIGCMHYIFHKTGWYQKCIHSFLCLLFYQSKRQIFSYYCEFF
jgi:hypothetical protein